MITPAYRIQKFGRAWGLLCLVCDHISYIDYAIQNHFCPYCAVYLDTLPREFDPVATPLGRTPASALREEQMHSPLFQGGPEDAGAE